MWNLKEVSKEVKRQKSKESEKAQRGETRYYKIRASVFWCLVCIVCAMLIGVGIWHQGMSWEVHDSDEKSPSVQWVKKEPDAAKSKLKNQDECYLCGNHNRSLMGMFRNYEDLGIICVNEWYVLDMRIRNHDDSGNLIGSQGSRNVTYTSTGEDSCFFHCSPDSDRGISTVTVSYGSDSILDVKKVRNYLCQNCLDKVWAVMEVYTPEDEETKPRDLCLVDFQTMELYSLQGDYSAYYVRDYYVQVDDSREDELKVTAVYAPVLENGHKDEE